MDSHNFLAELKRRNVYKIAVAYLVAAWLVIQVATQVFPFFDIPTWALRLVVLILILGFPVALVLAWAFEITPEGIVRAEDVPPNASITRKTGRKLIGITAYDARFLALADRLGSRLVTEDARLRAAAPALTQSLVDALAMS